jgi:site-specific DNA recombinase
MATAWLEEQLNAWSGLVAPFQGNLTRDECVARMVAQFQERFGKPMANRPEQVARKCGAAYLRFSSDNSNPRSLAQQLRNILARAQQDGIFIPWHLVFSDAGITGTIAARVAYQQAKATILDPDAGVSCLYVDDIGRASRDLAELLSLFRSIVQLQKRAVAVSDCIDTDDQNSRMLLTFKGMFVEQFIEQLRSKVSRGMKDGHREGRVITCPAFGYRLVEVRQPDGTINMSQKGKVVRRLEKDPNQAPEVFEIFDKFVNKLWSAHAIAKDLNERGVLAPRFWTARNIVQILERHLYAGYEYWGKTAITRDAVTGKVTVINKDPSEWMPRREKPELQIITEEMFNKAQERLARLRDHWRKQRVGKADTSRTGLHPTMLIRPVCCGCRWPLSLAQSMSSGYASLKCNRSFDKKSVCGELGCKSVSMINKCVLAVLKEHVFTPEFLNRLLEAANASLVEMASRPKADTAPIKEQIAELTRQKNRLANRLMGQSEEGLDCLFEKLREMDRTIVKLREQVAAQESEDNQVPKPMEPGDMVKLLQGLESLFEIEVGASAAVLSRILGEVVAEPAEGKSKKGRAWRLRFTINGAAMMAETGRLAGCPTATTWEYLKGCGWIMPGLEETVVEVSESYLNRHDISRARQLRDKGHNVSQIAEIMGRTRPFVNRLLNPDYTYIQPASTSSGMNQRLKRYERLAVEGLKLKAKGLSIQEICGELKTRRDALLRAFEMAPAQGWDAMARQQGESA